MFADTGRAPSFALILPHRFPSLAKAQGLLYNQITSELCTTDRNCQEERIHPFIFFLDGHRIAADKPEASLTNNSLNTRRIAADIAKAYREKAYFPSAAVSIFNNTETLCRFTLGEAREDSLFDLASLTKIAVAALVLQSVNAGLCTLQSAVPDVLPAIRQHARLSGRLHKVTILQLLTHTAGLPAWYPFYTQPDFITALSEALKQPSPTGVTYSDIGFILLGKILEALHNKPLDALVQSRLAVPLGLKHLGYKPDRTRHILPSGFGNPSEEAMCANLGLPYEGFRPHTPIIGQVHDGNAWYAFHGVAGHAGIFSDLDGVKGLARHFLTTEDPLEIQAQQEQVSGRGLGFELGELYPRGCGHTGFTGTSIYLSRDLKVGCVILTNRCFYESGEMKLINPFRREMNAFAAEHFGSRQS